MSENETTRNAGLIDRRGFLRTTAGGSLAIAVAALLPASCAADYAHAVPGSAKLLALTAKEYATMRAAAEALLFGDVAVPADRITQRIDHELSLVGDPVRADVKTVLALIEHLTFLSGHITRFTDLPIAARVNYLHGWRDSRFALRRGAFQALKSFAYFYAYADDSTRPVTGFTGPWRERLNIAARPIDFGVIS